MYDGWQLLRTLGSLLSDSEPSPEHLHIIISDMLVLTFDEDDYRYHARSVLCSIPSLVSIPGIIDGPARPREYYFDLLRGSSQQDAEGKIRGRFLSVGDSRLDAVAAGMALQAVFYSLLDGEPFCLNSNCRLFNAHWQEELIHAQLISKSLCTYHSGVLATYNAIAALFEKQ
jgi:hypothetical protein